MIKKNAETGKGSFKKFSEINKDKISKEPEEVSGSIQPDELPASPNIPVVSTKVGKSASTRYIKPLADKQDYNKDESNDSLIDEDHKVRLYGKVAKLPKGVKASKGFNFLENVKISKNSIWYLMIEKDENELQMVKYNYKKGVDLSKFIGDLKAYYISKYQTNAKIVKMVESISIDGNDKYSWIKNIPLIEVDGKKLITKITEDLIKLLSK